LLVDGVLLEGGRELVHDGGPGVVPGLHRHQSAHTANASPMTATAATMI
jgi:hypothetical protein